MRGRNDSSGKERMFCQAVAERELSCQLMGHVQCEPRILQRLSPFYPLLSFKPSCYLHSVPLAPPMLSRQHARETKKLYPLTEY